MYALIPKTLKLPIVLKICGNPAAELPSDVVYARELQTDCVPRVAIKAATFRYPTKTPLIIPTKIATPIIIRIPIKTLPVFAIYIPLNIPLIQIIMPTDKSIPPETMTNV